MKRLLLAALCLSLSTKLAISGVVGTADLSVMKTGPSDAAPDTDVSYTIEVINNGPDQASAASLNDGIPANTTFVSFTQNSGPTWSCSSPAVGGGGTVSCNNGTLAAGAHSVFTLVVHVAPGTAGGTAITNIATVNDPSDPSEENNSSSATTFVSGTPPDVGVTKTADTDQALDGSNVIYTITVTNTVGTATNVTLSDTLPNDITPANQN